MSTDDPFDFSGPSPESRGRPAPGLGGPYDGRPAGSSPSPWSGRSWRDRFRTVWGGWAPTEAPPAGPFDDLPSWTHGPPPPAGPGTDGHSRPVHSRSVPVAGPAGRRATIVAFVLGVLGALAATVTLGGSIASIDPVPESVDDTLSEVYPWLAGFGIALLVCLVAVMSGVVAVVAARPKRVAAIVLVVAVALPVVGMTAGATVGSQILQIRGVAEARSTGIPSVIDSVRRAIGG